MPVLLGQFPQVWAHLSDRLSLFLEQSASQNSQGAQDKPQYCGDTMGGESKLSPRKIGANERGVPEKSCGDRKGQS